MLCQFFDHKNAACFRATSGAFLRQYEPPNYIFTVVAKPQRILSRDKAATYVGSEDNLRRLINSKYLKPIGGKKRNMDFDIRQLDVALDAVVMNGEWPADPKKAASEPKHFEG